MSDQAFGPTPFTLFHAPSRPVPGMRRTENLDRERARRCRGAGCGADGGAIFESPVAANEEAVPLTLLINPVIEPFGEEKVVGLEACLSLPGLAGLVPRFKRIRYRGLAPDGTAIEREAEGFHARVVQHECDHLDGVLYPERMADLSTLTFTSEMARPEAL